MLLSAIYPTHTKLQIKSKIFHTTECVNMCLDVCENRQPPELQSCFIFKCFFLAWRGRRAGHDNQQSNGDWLSKVE